MFASTIPLNSHQKTAVEYVAGPLLLIAGAGTGKTTTIIEKLSYLIHNKLAKPDEILCLTFTEKASFEMKERVDLVMPYGYSQLWISTFHSFADEILRNEAHHLGLSSAYTIMTEAQAIHFIKAHLFEFKLKYFRPLSSPNSFVGALLQHFSRLQDEDVSAETYEQWIKKQSNNLSSTQEINPKQFKKEEDQSDNDYKNQLLELSGAYSVYQKLKSQHDVLDFSDLIFYLNKLFRTRPHVLSEYQKQFKYVLVDEFQDTNVAQYESIKLLCPPKRNPNLTVVGDDSQAIYKFRGASVSNILMFMEDYKTAKQLTLVDNYRSNQNILDHAYQLIQNNNPDTLESRLGISKELVSHKNNNKDSVVCELFQKDADEADWIAKQVSELITSKKYSYTDISVLLRANKHSEPIVQSFKALGIPYQFGGPGSLFKQPEVKDLMAYIKFLSNLDDSVSFFRVLNMDIYKFDMEDLILLLSFSKKTSLSLYQAIEIYLSFNFDEWKRKDNEIYKNYLPLLTEPSKKLLMSVMKMIKRHIDRIKKDSAGEILYYFLQDTEYLNTLSNPTTILDERRTLNISKFFKRLKEIQNSMEDTSVFSVSDYFSLSMEIGESPSAGIDDLNEINAVHILTIHSAKGLEFPVVFLPDCVNGRFPTYRRRETIPIPDGLIKEILPEGDFHTQEERRLFYVGMTRAKDVLYLTASELYNDGKKHWKVSPFLVETIGEKNLAPKKLLEIDKKGQLSIFEFQKKDEPLIKLPPEVKNISYSQIQTYNLCPLQYKYHYILNIPTQAASGASFGSTIHHVLQKFYKEFMTDRTIGVPHLLNLLESSWIPIGYSSQAHQKRMKEEAKHMLENYFHSFHTPEINVLDLEKLFKIRIADTVFLTGKIDRVDLKGKDVIEIIDYKTGKLPDEKKLQKDLQLSIYAAAASHKGLYGKPLENIHLSFYYLQSRKKITVQRSAEDILNVESMVKETVENIRNEKYEPHVGQWCDFCNFRMICEAWQ